MAKSAKTKHFHFSFQVILRLALFILVVAILISYFSKQEGDALGVSVDVSGNAYISEVSQKLWKSLPPESRQTLDNLSRLPVTQIVGAKLEYLKTQTEDFPQKQIKEIQKGIINKVAEELVKKIEN